MVNFPDFEEQFEIFENLGSLHVSINMANVARYPERSRLLLTGLGLPILHKVRAQWGVFLPPPKPHRQMTFDPACLQLHLKPLVIAPSPSTCAWTQVRACLREGQSRFQTACREPHGQLLPRQPSVCPVLTLPLRLLPLLLLLLLQVKGAKAADEAPAEAESTEGEEDELESDEE